MAQSVQKGRRLAEKKELILNHWMYVISRAYIQVEKPSRLKGVKSKKTQNTHPFIVLESEEPFLRKSRREESLGVFSEHPQCWSTSCNVSGLIASHFNSSPIHKFTGLPKLKASKLGSGSGTHSGLGPTFHHCYPVTLDRS